MFSRMLVFMSTLVLECFARLPLARRNGSFFSQVMAINALAPFIINGKLRGLMERSPPLAPLDVDSSTPSDASSSSSSSSNAKPLLKFIVNVSAMEGKFYRFKNANHPHTNMAKVTPSILISS